MINKTEIVGLDVGPLVPKLAKFVVFSGAFRVESVREGCVSAAGCVPDRVLATSGGFSRGKVRISLLARDVFPLSRE